MVKKHDGKAKSRAAEPASSAVIVGSALEKSSAHKKRIRMMIGLTAFILVVVLGGYLAYPRAKDHLTPTGNKIDQELALVAEYEQKNDTANALVHAKKLLEYEPNNQDYIALVASLSELQNPADGKAYYAKMLDDIRKGDDNPDLDGKRISTYWAAAGLAEKAGENDQAKKYYQKVIEVANRADGYENDLVKQSQAALERLK